MPRCIIDVFDQAKHKERKCLHKRKWVNICSFHARKYVVKIQAAWRMYKCRKTVNLFKNIGDPWCFVLKYINQRNNIVKIYKSHYRIYQRRQEAHREQVSRLRNLSYLYASQWRAQIQAMNEIEAEDTKLIYLNVERLRGVEIDLLYKAQDSMKYFAKLIKN